MARTFENKGSDQSNRNQLYNKEFDVIYSKRTFSPEKLIMEYEEKCLKEIPAQQWSQDRWLNKRASLTSSKNVSLDTQDFSDKPFIIYTTNKPQKNEGEIVKLSLTKKLFSEYKDKGRLHRADRDNCFSKNSSKPFYRPKTSSGDAKGSRTGRLIAANETDKPTIIIDNRVSAINEKKPGFWSLNASPRRDESPKNSQREPPESPGKSQLKLHKAFSSLISIKSLSLDQQPRPPSDWKRALSQKSIAPSEYTDQPLQFGNQHQRYTNVKLNDLFSPTTSVNPTLYNRTIFGTNKSTSRPKSRSIGLQVREQLSRIGKSSENSQRRVHLGESPTHSAKYETIGPIPALRPETTWYNSNSRIQFNENKFSMLSSPIRSATPSESPTLSLKIKRESQGYNRNLKNALLSKNPIVIQTNIQK